MMKIIRKYIVMRSGVPVECSGESLDHMQTVESPARLNSRWHQGQQSKCLQSENKEWCSWHHGQTASDSPPKEGDNDARVTAKA